MMFTILPFIILLIILGILIMVYRMIMLSNRRFVTSNRVYTVLGGYFIVLLVSLGIFSVSPYPESSVLSEKTDDEKTQTYGMYYDVTEEGVLIDHFKDYQANEWEFEFSGEKLDIRFNDNESYDLPIIIERKGLVDDTVEVVLYSTPSSVEGIDLSSMIRSFEINLIEGDVNVLEVIEPHDIIDVVTFEKEFIFNQFSDDGTEDMFSSPYVEIGENMLYILIPSGVEIQTNDYVEIEYIN